jgi:hypothetical protein
MSVSVAMDFLWSSEGLQPIVEAASRGFWPNSWLDAKNYVSPQIHLHWYTRTPDGIGQPRMAWSHASEPSLPIRSLHRHRSKPTAGVRWSLPAPHEANGTEPH